MDGKELEYLSGREHAKATSAAETNACQLGVAAPTFKAEKSSFNCCTSLMQKASKTGVVTGLQIREAHDLISEAPTMILKISRIKFGHDGMSDVLDARDVLEDEPTA